MAKKKQGLSKKEQEQLVKAAANGYNNLSSGGKSIVMILIVVALIVGAIWYFGFGGKEKLSQTTNTAASSTATTAAQVLPYGPEGTYDPTAWEENSAPNYYRLAVTAVVNHPEVSIGQIQYGELDDLGRATWACGNLTPELYQKELDEPRESNLPNPAGWPKNNKKVDIVLCNGDVVNYEMFNRSHLLADSLGGDPIRENLVTGTRMQNVGSNNQGKSGYGGMAFSEDEARQYLSEALKNGENVSLYYCATPVYLDNELVPRSVYVDIKSSDGKIDQHIEVFNCAKGYEMNYVTGDFWAKN